METYRQVLEWCDALNVEAQRPGWGRWEEVGGSVLEGVQNWSEGILPEGAVGVWGNETEEGEIQWCVYVGDDREPVRCGFEGANAAMQWAEREFPNAFPMEG